MQSRGRALADRTDETLWSAYLGGEAVAFEALFARHRRALYSYLVRMTTDRAAADEIFQETFSRLIDRRPRFATSGELRAWLYRVARNLLIDGARRQRHRQALSLDGAHRDGEGNTPLVERLATSDPDPESEAARREVQHALAEALAALSSEQRETILLRERSGFTVAEIARLMGCPSNTVKSRLRYGLEHLRRALGSRYGVPDTCATEARGGVVR